MTMKNRNSKGKHWIVICLAAAVLIIAGGYTLYGMFRVETTEAADGSHMKFRTQGDRFEIYHNKVWEPLFLQGVNLGAAMPGYYPGDLAINKETYLRWFGMMTEMGSNVVRVYTIHPPHFYEALVEYNRSNRDRPLYLIQGVWSPEELLAETRDAYDPQITELFHQEISDAVGAVYGDVTLEPSPGKASGKFSANAGSYLLGWHIGTEWDPQMVVDTNEHYAETARYAGAYFQATPEASPFESWLAELLDLTASLEHQRGYQHPIAFTNWVTTDPLDHPGEPTLEEDMVSVNAAHIEPIDWEAGYYASYHVYPYYPDLFRFDESLREVVNTSGEADPYQTYLRRLKAYHADMPVIIAEFGVPSSWGIGHTEWLGRDQGGHNEKQQGEIAAGLFEAIVEEELAGAILFAWHDEWFKKTWNTMRYEEPADRRAYWLNVLSNEQNFGLIGMYASKSDAILIDGKSDDWDKLNNGEKTQLLQDGIAMKQLWVAHDEAYVYVRGVLNRPFNSAEETIYIGIDTLPGGNRHAEELGDKRLDEGLEALIILGPEGQGEIKIASNYDFHTRLYGKQYRMLPVQEEEMKDDSGLFYAWKLAVGLLMEPPYTKVHHPFEEVTAGKLIRGTTDPSKGDYDSLASWNTKGNEIELRIPWGLLGYSDPSSLQAISYADTGDKTFAADTSEGIRFVPWIKEQSGSSIIGLDSPSSTFPITNMPIYRWEEWTETKYVERKKQSYEIVKQAFLTNKSKGKEVFQ
jgi:hypothetical protein